MLKTIAAVILLASAAWAQDVPRTYRFANISTTQGYQQIANVFRMCGDIKDISVDDAARTLVTHGTPEQMALTDWLFSQLDVKGTPAPVSHQYQTTGPIPVVRVFYFAHTPSTASAQEIVNVVRTGADVARAAVSWESRSLTVRATSDSVAAAAWLFSQLDAAEPSPGAATQSYRLPGVFDPEMRVVHLAHATQPVEIQELINSVRIIAETNRVFPVNLPGIIMMRGTADMIATAQWLLAQLDVAPNQQGPAPHEQQVPTTWDPVAHVFYLKPTVTPAAAQQIVNTIRASAKVQRIYPCNHVNAVAVRGSAAQITEAATLIAQLDQ